MQSSSNKRLLSPVVIVVIVLLIFVSVLFLLAFALSNQQPVVPEDITVDTYREEVEQLLQNADVARGEELVKQGDCAVCHIEGAGNIAPAFDGIATRAADIRLPLSAEAYLYESIAYPGAHVVENFQDAMPRAYLNQLPPQDFGDMIAYLLTQTD